jgi:hypothetical protein
MTYTEDSGYEPALHRDLEPIEQAIRELTVEVARLGARVADLEREVRVQHAAIEGLADQP